MSQRFVIELNADFKPKMIRQRKEFMANLILTLTGDNPESEKKLLEYGVKIITQRDNGDDIAVMLNGERVYKG